MTTYYEFQARRVQRAEVALDIVEFEIEEEADGIEVQEQAFDTWEELFAHVKHVLGELE